MSLRGREHEIPILLWIQRQSVLTGEELERARTQFLIIISRQGQRELRCERQGAAQAISTQSIGIKTRAGGKTETKIMLELRERIDEQRASPNEMGEVMQLTITREPVRSSAGSIL